MTTAQVFLAIGSGGVVGFALGLIGGGGSILAVPLLLYVVGIKSPHLVIGSTALAVAINAYINLIPHWRAHHVQWPAAVTFAIPGAIGAVVGAELGKAVNGKALLFLFALLMLLIAGLMLRPQRQRPRDNTSKTLHWPRVTITGLLTGAVSGFFGIGGGFLIVPGLMFSTGMPMIMAIGTSLFSVGTFGLTTAVDYAASGLVDWSVVAAYVGGGIFGGLAGTLLATRLARHKSALTYTFSGVIILVAGYMLWVNYQSLH